MVKILGLLDLAAVGALLGVAYNFSIPHGIIIGLATFLLLKGLVFFFDVGSWFDIAGGILLILSLSMTIHPIILFVAAALVGLKGIASLFA
jgi:hypothetical protein